MGKKSKIAELGMLNILYQMKNPITNIRLSLEELESGSECDNCQACHDIIRNSAISLENSIRELCNSFKDLGVSIHIEEDVTPLS